MTTYNEWLACYRICGYCTHWGRIHQRQVRMFMIDSYVMAACDMRGCDTRVSDGNGCILYEPTSLAKLALREVEGGLIV